MATDIKQTLFILLLSFLVVIHCFKSNLRYNQRYGTELSVAVTPAALSTLADEELSFSIEKNRQQFQWDEQWYPLFVEDFTDKNKTHASAFLGNDVVVFYDGSSWRCLEDSCPHRGVPLSEGRVEKNGELLCSYHAWRFSGEGKCVDIPQTSRDFAIDKVELLKEKACVKSYPTMLKQGLIWVWGKSGEPGSDVAIAASLKQARLIEELSDPQYEGRVAKYTYNFRELPYGWDMFMENVVDPAHVVVSHHNIVGNRYTDSAPISMRPTPSRSETPLAQGGELDPLYPEDAGFKYYVKSAAEKLNKTISSNDFRPPCLNKITTEYVENGARLILALYCTPTRPGYSRHIGAQIFVKDDKGKTPPGLGFFSIPMPAWLVHPLASFFLHQDQVFLHHQERMLYSSSNYAFGDFSNSKGKIDTTSDPRAYASTYFLPNAHDKQITRLRHWIHNKAGGGVKWGAAALMRGLPPRLAGPELFDVYNSHTKHCASCTKALKTFLRIRNLSVALSVLALGFIHTAAKSIAPKILVSSFFAAVAIACHKFAKLYYKYEFSHQHNN